MFVRGRASPWYTRYFQGMYSLSREGVLALLVLPLETPTDEEKEEEEGGGGGCSLNGNGERARSGLPEYLFPATDNETTSLK